MFEYDLYLIMDSCIYLWTVKEKNRLLDDITIINTL